MFVLILFVQFFVANVNNALLLALQDPVRLRSLCLGVTPEANYRIQYDSSKARIFFSFLPDGEAMLMVPQDEELVQEAGVEEEHVDVDVTMQSADTDQPGEGETGKRSESGSAGEGSSPPTKRAKLKY